jgi:hypothetical protein
MDQHYECPTHKIIVNGLKRENFKEDFYTLLMSVSMLYSMRLYKEVNVDCHCKNNYEAFDRIKQESAGALK